VSFFVPPRGFCRSWWALAPPLGGIPSFPLRFFRFGTPAFPFHLRAPSYILPPLLSVSCNEFQPGGRRGPKGFFYCVRNPYGRPLEMWNGFFFPRLHLPQFFPLLTSSYPSYFSSVPPSPWPTTDGTKIPRLPPSCLSCSSRKRPLRNQSFQVTHVTDRSHIFKFSTTDMNSHRSRCPSFFFHNHLLLSFSSIDSQCFQAMFLFASVTVPPPISIFSQVIKHSPYFSLYSSFLDCAPRRAFSTPRNLGTLLRVNRADIADPSRFLGRALNITLSAACIPFSSLQSFESCLPFDECEMLTPGRREFSLDLQAPTNPSVPQASARPKKVSGVVFQGSWCPFLTLTHWRSQLLPSGTRHVFSADACRPRYSSYQRPGSTFLARRQLLVLSATGTFLFGDRRLTVFIIHMLAGKLCWVFLAQILSDQHKIMPMDPPLELTLNLFWRPIPHLGSSFFPGYFPFPVRFAVFF